MYKILIDELEKQPNKTLFLEFNDKISELEECSVVANLEIKSLGDFIEVVGDVQGTIKLECDRCLEKFDYNLDFEIEETYAKFSLYEEYSQEVELKSGQFVTDLNGEKEIDIYNLLYQSVILNLPNKKVCGINCNEGKFTKDDEMFVQDERMAVFKTIKIENN